VKRKEKKKPKGYWYPPYIIETGKKDKIFGVNYVELIERLQSKNMIPPFLDTIFIELEKRGFKRVGIFRISASFDKIEELKIKIDKEENINYSELDEILLSCILKLFLREIPEPLFTLQYYGEWLSLLNIPEEKKD